MSSLNKEDLKHKLYNNKLLLKAVKKLIKQTKAQRQARKYRHLIFIVEMLIAGIVYFILPLFGIIFLIIFPYTYARTFFKEDSTKDIDLNKQYELQKKYSTTIDSLKKEISHS